MYKQNMIHDNIHVNNCSCVDEKNNRYSTLFNKGGNSSFVGIPLLE